MLVACLILALLSCVAAGSTQVVRVGFYENAPKLFTDETGQVAGFFPEIIEAIAAEEGWDLEYVSGTWVECLDRLEAGEIDLMPDVAYSAARAEMYGFAEEPLFINWGVIYQRPGAGIESILDLTGRRIAVMEGSIHTEGEQGIKAILAQFDIDSTFVELPDYTAVFEALRAGEAEAGAVNRLFGLLNEDAYDVATTMIVFNPRELRFAYPLGSEFGEQLAERIDEHVLSMKADPDSVYYRSLTTYLLREAPSEIHRIPQWLPWLLGGGGAIIVLSALAIQLLRRRQRRLRTELAASEVQFETMFEKAAVGIAILKAREGLFLRANPRFCEMMGYTEPELQRLHVDDIFYPEDPGRGAPRVHDVIEGGSDRLVSENRFLRKDGSTLWGRITRSMVEGPSGERVHGIAVIEDITDRRRAEEEREDLLHQMAERVKELNCLYRVAESSRSEDTLEEIFQAVAGLIPPAWQYPEITRARIVFDEKEFLSEPFMPTDWKQTSDIAVDGDSHGSVEVFYMEERPDAIEGPFLSEERDLIDGLARTLGEAVERRQAEVDMRGSEERLTLATQAAKVGVWDWNVADNALLWDESMYALYGIRREDFEGAYEAWQRGVHPDDLEEVNAAEQAALRGESNFETEFRVIWPDGAVRTLRGVADVHRDEAGNPTRMVGVNWDITESRRAQGALEQSEQRLKEAQAIAHLGHWILDLELDILIWSEEVYRIFGEDPLSFAPSLEAFFERVHPDDRDAVSAALESGLRGESYDIEHRILTGGDTKWVRQRARIERAEDGSVIRGLGVIADITEQRKAEESMRQYQFIVNSSQDMMTLIGPEYHYLAVSDSFCTYHRKERDEILGRTVAEIWGEKTFTESIRSSLDRCLAGRATGFDGWFSLLDAEPRYHEVRYTPFASAGTSDAFAVVVSRDITDKKHVESELEQHRENLERMVVERTEALNTAIEAANAASFRYDLLTGEVERDGRWFEISGIEEGQFDGTHEAWRRLVHPEDLPSAEANIEKAVASASDSMHHEYRIVRPDGEVRHIESRVRIQRDVEGQATALVGMNIDITDRRTAEEALRENEAFLRTMIENMPIDFFAVDRDLRYTMQSPTSREAVGDVIGLRAEDLETEEPLRSQWLAELREVLSGASSQREYDVPTTSGELRTYISSMAPVRVEGKIVAAIGTSIDITDRKRSEERIRQLSRAIEESPVSVIITDVEGSIEYVNPRFSEITGYSPEEALRQNPRLIKSGEQPESFYKDLWDTILAGEEWRGEFCNKKKSGELFWELSSISPIRDETGRITHFVAVHEDITERKYVAWELEQAKSDAEGANRAKSDFLANMSHELRTPLNAVIGFSEILEDETFGELSERQHQYVGNIQQSGRHLLSLINDILDLSKVEAGKMELDLADVDVSRLLFESLVFVQEKAHTHGIELTTDVSDEAQALTIRADERKLKQVLYNLLSNAAKFTPEGGAIEVTGDVAADEVVVKVRDTGIGVRPENLHRIFDEFEQLDTGYAKAVQGTGLGLALSKRLIELHNGRIWAESEGEGKGSTFTFTLPIVHRDAGEGRQPNGQTDSDC